MKLKRLIDELQELKLPDAEVLISLPGNRFSPVTLTEKIGKTEEDKSTTYVVCLYPHPRDLAAAATGGGAGASPDGTRHPIVEGIDAVLDFLGGNDAAKGEGK